MTNDQIKRYYELLTQDFAGINLTRIIDFEEFQNKQVLDSLAPYEQSTTFKDDLNNAKAYIDIGFGGGFPLLPLTTMLDSNKKIYGIETRKKKADVVAKIARELGIHTIKFIHSRLENVLIDIEAVCTLKAVGKVNDFLSKISTTKTISVYFYKAKNFYEIEKKQLELACKEWDIIEEREIIVPGTEKRYLIGFRNKNVLRGTKQNLVKLSNFH